MKQYKEIYDDVPEDEATIEISNNVFKSLKFRTKEEAINFVNQYCSNLWTKLKRKTENGWVVAGSILPEKQEILHKLREKNVKDHNTLI